MKNLKSIMLVLVAALVYLSFNSRHEASSSILKRITPNSIYSTPNWKLMQDLDTTEWVAPSSANDMINPIEANEKSIEEGSLVYRRTCRSCHGRNGDGNGVEAANLSTPVPDFSDPAHWEQSDGSLFWKISEGRNDMLPLKDELSEADIWNVINYIKTFLE